MSRSNKQIRGVVRAILGGIGRRGVHTALCADRATGSCHDRSGGRPAAGSGRHRYPCLAAAEHGYQAKRHRRGGCHFLRGHRSVPGRQYRRRHCAHPGRDGESRYDISCAGAPTATGATQGINVRGFGGSFNEVLLEGRPIASGNGQTFNFSDFSSVYVGEVDVLKTPDMSLSTGTIGATINVKFPNPMDKPGSHAQLFGQENLYQLNGGSRPWIRRPGERHFPGWHIWHSGRF